jgi:hypothetical protein
VIWIIWRDEDGNEGSARWGSSSDEALDSITQLAADLLGPADTVT